MTPDAAPPSDPPADPKSPAPRYRHFIVPPATVRLPVDDITALLPDGAWIGTDADKHRELALPTTEVLEKNFPRIRFARLADLLPGCIQSVADAPEWIVLPTDRIALAYRPETRRELIADDEPKVDAAGSDAPIPAWKRIGKPVLAPPPEPAKEREPAPPSLGERRLPPETEARFQQIFMTDDALPVARLVELAGALPGLQGIVLAHGATAVRSSDHLARIDAAALTAGATDVLEKMGASSGLQLRPAVTLYAESGPVSFLRNGPLHLVVIHRERAFLPGVREKLDALLEAVNAGL